MKEGGRRKTRNIRAIIATEVNEDQQVTEEYPLNSNKGNKNNKSNPWLVLTSTTFLIPATLFALQGNWLLYASNLAVVTVATVYHASKWNLLYYVDVATANQLAFLHTLYAIQQGYGHIPLPGILYSMLMFIYGHKYRCFVWDPSYEVATAWHMTMHVAVMASAVATAMLV
jgi:hypothetical protein